MTGVELLRGEVERIVAAAGGQLRTVRDVGEAAPFWDAAAAVLLGSDIRELPPRGRSPAVLVGLNGDGDRLWHLAAAIGAERVAVLPDAATWLAEYLSRVPHARSRRTGPWDCRRLRRRRGQHGRRLAGPGRRPGGCACAAGGRRPVGRRAWNWRSPPRKRPGLRWPDLAEASGSDRSPPARRFPAPGRGILVPVLAREQGTATAEWTTTSRGRGAGRRPARLRAGGAWISAGDGKRCGPSPGTATGSSSLRPRCCGPPSQRPGSCRTFHRWKPCSWCGADPGPPWMRR